MSSEPDGAPTGADRVPVSGANGAGSADRAAPLEVEGLVAGYGGVTALHDVTVTAGAGAITAVLGANDGIISTASLILARPRCCARSAA